MWIPIYICIGVIWAIIRFILLSTLVLGGIKYDYWKPLWVALWLIDTVFLYPIQWVVIVGGIVKIFIPKTRDAMLKFVDECMEMQFEGYEEL